MKMKFKLLSQLAEIIRRDLIRPHIFATERVGFISCRVGRIPDGIVILAHNYHPIDDEDYLDDPGAGATMGPAAIRKSLQYAYSNEVSMFHVHMHDHRGRPRFSGLDVREHTKFVPDFFNVRPELPHGTIVLSRDSAAGKYWPSSTHRPMVVTEFIFVGSPIRKVR